MKAEVREKVIQKVVVLEIPWEEAVLIERPQTTFAPFVREVVAAVRDVVLGDRHWWEPAGPTFAHPFGTSRCARCGLLTLREPGAAAGIGPCPGGKRE